MGDEERSFKERLQPGRDRKERTHTSGAEEREGRSSRQGDYGQGGYWEAEGSGHEPRGCGGQADNEQTGHAMSSAGHRVSLGNPSTGSRRR
jgi:hypothetical protein